jgi:uncharacterized secreted protein with C-terminal beta-propeller domain
MRTVLALGLATALLVGACSSGTPQTQPRRPDPIIAEPAGELVAFDGCDELNDYVADQAATWWRGGPDTQQGRFMEEDSFEFAAPAAAQTADDGAASDLAGDARSDFSTTNNQEAGVDEADVVKTDGDLVLTTTDGTLRVLDATGREPELVGSLELPDGSNHELLLHGDRLLVLSVADLTIPVDPQQQRSGWPTDRWVATTLLTEVDIADPAHPEAVASKQVDGSYHAARAIDGTARIVVTSEPAYHQLPAPVIIDEDVFDVERPLFFEGSEWLPATTTVADDGDLTREPLVGCGDVIRATETEVAGASTVTVLTVDLTEPLDDLQPTTVMGTAEYIYASADNLYLAGTAWSDDGAATTEIHQLALDGSAPAHYQSSGAVTGQPLNQFAFSEHDERLRVATTVQGWTELGNQSDSAVTVLERSDEVLRQVGRVDGMGQGEEIYAVRFLGDTAYVVTFRQTDPLYTVDLSDPTDPRVVGELKIPGYSAYLHPIGGDQLLGVGQDADENGRVLGLQVSLFDVADPADPVRLQNYTLPHAVSDAEYDHRAFLWWAAEGLAVIPMNGYDRGNYVNAAVGLDVGPDAITEIGRIVHEGAPGVGPGSPPFDCPPEADCVVPIDAGLSTGTIVRSLVVNDDQLWTVSDLGVEISDVDTLTLEGWISFR